MSVTRPPGIDRGHSPGFSEPAMDPVEALLLAAPAGNGAPVPFLTLVQLASRLDVPRSTLTEWVKRGLVPARACFGVRKDGRPLAYLFAVAQLPALARLVTRLRRAEAIGGRTLP